MEKKIATTKELDDIVFGLLEFIINNIKEYTDKDKMRIIHSLSMLLWEYYIEQRIRHQLKQTKAKRKKKAIMVPTKQ